MAYDLNAPQATKTEWEDVLVKHKVIEAREAPKTVDQQQAEDRDAFEEDAARDFENMSLRELDAREDELDEDDLDRLRRKRMQELEARVAREKFGQIYSLSQTEYKQEVNEASANGQWVLCCLYLSGQPASDILLARLGELAVRHKDVKFTKIVGKDCIPDYPDAFCPTLILYKDCNPMGNIRGIAQFGGKACTADMIEWQLAKMGVWNTELDSAPKHKKHQTKLTKMTAQDRARRMMEMDDSEDDSDF